MNKQVTHRHIGQEPGSPPLRRVGISPNHWYAVAQATDLGAQPIARELWHQPIVLYRTTEGICALEDRCAHRFVRLSHGRLAGNAIECAYHGWRFDRSGECVHIPHLAKKPVLPKCPVRAFPAQEKNGFLWVFPGDPRRAHESVPTAMTAWDDASEIHSVARLSYAGHFSYLIENLMDMYHGRLHAAHQVWTADDLLQVKQDPHQVTATYEATTYYRISGLTSILQLVIPQLRRPYRTPLTVTYDYPNWRAELGDDFKIYCLITPVNERRTEAHLIHYTSLKKFAALSNAPLGVRTRVKSLLNNCAKPLLKNLVREDVLMIEEEQAAFDSHPEREPFEVNRTLLRVQQLIRHQAQAGRTDSIEHL